MALSLGAERERWGVRGDRKERGRRWHERKKKREESGK